MTPTTADRNRNGGIRLKRFAVILHPLHPSDFRRWFGWLRFAPVRWTERVAASLPPFALSRIRGIQSTTGEEVEGWLIVVPMTSHELEKEHPLRLLQRLEQAGRMAEQLGAEIVGVGGHLRFLGHRAAALSGRLPIPVTTGVSLALASSIKAAVWASEQVGIRPESARVAIVGAASRLGRVCSELLAPIFPQLMLIDSQESKLVQIASALSNAQFLRLSATSDLRRGMSNADLIFVAGQTAGGPFSLRDASPGSVVCDVSPIRKAATSDISPLRTDVLSLQGGAIRVPGRRVELGAAHPNGTVGAEIAEAMILALEGRRESYSVGDLIHREKIQEIARLALKHGFSVTALHQSGHPVDEPQIAAVRKASGRDPALHSPSGAPTGTRPSVPPFLS